MCSSDLSVDGGGGDTGAARDLPAQTGGVQHRAGREHPLGREPRGLVGEHGDTEFPLWSAARINAVPILDWRSPEGDPLFTVEELDRIAVDVREAAYKVIQGKGATNYAIGLSSARIVEAILGDENAVLNVSSVLQDFHGIDGVALSVPSIVRASGVHPIRETPFDEAELEKLRSSAAALEKVAAGLRG